MMLQISDIKQFVEWIKHNVTLPQATDNDGDVIINMTGVGMLPHWGMMEKELNVK